MGLDTIDQHLAATLDAVARFTDSPPLAQVDCGGRSSLSAALWQHSARRRVFSGHRRHILAISLRGDARLEHIVDGRSVWRGPAPGSVILLRDGEATDWHLVGSFEMLHVYLNFDASQQEINAQHLSRPFRDPLLFQMGLTAGLAVREGCGDRRYMAPLLEAIQQCFIERHLASAQVGRRETGTGLSGPARRRVEGLVRQRLAERVSAHEMAAAAQLSVGHFNRAFRQTFGISPYQYVLDQRIAHASRLLRETPLALPDVAVASGFKNYSNFGAQFRRAIGISPRDYRQSS